MEIEILYEEEFEEQMNSLFDILYSRKYFSFEEDAVDYIKKIYGFIESKISLPISRNSAEKFQKYGKKLIKYKANQRTTWYIFFDQKGNQFLINHILNNHSQDFPELL